MMIKMASIRLRLVFVLLSIAGAFCQNFTKRNQPSVNKRDVTVKCGSNQFACWNLVQCVEKSQVCDTIVDCKGGTDEFRCQKRPCYYGKERCDNHICIYKTKLCDGKDDCGTGWDENNQTRCGSGECVPRYRMCDRYWDCKDGTDELKLCEDFVCAENEIKCDNHICILKTWVCDGQNHCGNGWDEKNCG
ncbi:low-density lipoprotein receptor-related protein 8-like isoform X2 [Physella acuta]|uniref:low-density lipoprotein receptor-related protein 8-like isoform X2 n=1 Tax=Physella acuta TaxID=109671 RepID=UPI0027DE4261|nr:low-density lipoprotein receptor-related protein 8-like isoform X2 [Physella acuta]